MLIVNAMLAGAIAISSWRVMHRRRQRKLMYWLTIGQQNPFSDDYDSRRALERIDKRVNTSYQIAIYSLGLTLVGVIVYTPITAISVPFTLYSALPLLERTIENSLKRLEVNGDLVGSCALVFSIAVDNYLLASLLQVLLALNEKLALTISKQRGAYYDPNATRPSISFEEFVDSLRREMRQAGDTIMLDSSFVRPVEDGSA